MSSSLLFQRGKELKERLANVRETIQKSQEIHKNQENRGEEEKGFIEESNIERSPETAEILMFNPPYISETQIKEFKPCKKEDSLLFPDNDCTNNDEETLSFHDGKKYKGDLKNGKFHGKGILIYSSGAKYSGEFRENKLHGEGTLIYPNGFRYSGQFVNNKPNGRGILVFPDGSRYEGEFRDGKFQGHGILTFNTGAQYVGQFNNDKRHGQGTISYPNGFKYVGQFIDNKSNGHGMLIFPDGTKYVGQFRNDKRHGQGTISYPNGLKYVGQFRNEKYHGHGTLTLPDGTHYEGQFSDDKYHGYGTLTFPDGTQYEGEFSENKYHGHGTMTFLDGNKVIGIFADGNIQESLPYIPRTEDENIKYPEQKEKSATKNHSYREKFKPVYRTTDGHYVRSKSEVLLDNWLYMNGIIHVYEKRLPVKEEIYSNFYLPKGNVYIEYLHDETEPDAKRNIKIETYKKYNLNLVELDDNDIDNIDDILPERLLHFDIKIF